MLFPYIYYFHIDESSSKLDSPLTNIIELHPILPSAEPTQESSHDSGKT